jgi:hypothetical protein
MYSGDEVYGDDVTSGLEDVVARVVAEAPVTATLDDVVERVEHEWAEDERAAFETYWADSDPVYREAMTSAGRSELLR